MAMSLAGLDSASIGDWLATKRTKVDSARVKVVGDEVEMTWTGGRLTIRQAGGVACEFTDQAARDLLVVAITGRTLQEESTA